MTIEGKIDLLSEALAALRARVAGSLQGNEPWGEALSAVRAVESTLRSVRSAVRARERKVRRAICSHPPEKRHAYQDGSSLCSGCGLAFKPFPQDSSGVVYNAGYQSAAGYHD